MNSEDNINPTNSISNFVPRPRPERSAVETYILQ
jgi:hypothetical protein